MLLYRPFRLPKWSVNMIVDYVKMRSAVIGRTHFMLFSMFILFVKLAELGESFVLSLGILFSSLEELVCSLGE